MALETGLASSHIASMANKQPKHQNNNAKATESWESEGGAPATDDHSPARKRPRDLSQWAKRATDIVSGEVEDREPTPEEQGKDPAAVAMGKKGGKARADSLSADQRKEIARKAAHARWQADDS